MESVATIQVRTTAERREQIKNHAEATGESVNVFINRAISETMKRDNTAGGIDVAKSDMVTPVNSREK